MTLKNIPNHLEKYIVKQNYDRYNVIDHQVWKFIMQISIPFFKKHAHKSYFEGLEKTGITKNKIPLIKKMDEKLAKFGWGAVPVRGFIPPWDFMKFQALGVLPIACDMRSSKNLTYTPAPDIVHESAGHSPIIINDEYAYYLKEYGRIALNATFNEDDQRIYRAIRKLSDLKENIYASPNEIEKAEKALIDVRNNQNEPSEATLLSRLHWWTVEYGLIGDIDNPKIYGAGLLSSVGESQNCLDSKVKKLPFSIDCIKYNYDITEQQPQLFVAKDFSALTRVLHEFEKTMSYNSCDKIEKFKDENIIKINNEEPQNFIDEKIMNLYENFEGDNFDLDKTMNILNKEYPDEWLLRFKIYRRYYNQGGNWLKHLRNYLTNYRLNSDMNSAILRGLKIVENG